jgi:hypothetical protein
VIANLFPTLEAKALDSRDPSENFKSEYNTTALCSLHLEHGTAVVGTAWAAELPAEWRSAPLTSKMMAPNAKHHNNHTPWVHTTFPPATGGGHADTNEDSTGTGAAHRQHRRQQQHPQHGMHVHDARAQERAEYESALRRGAEERDVDSLQYQMNRARCVGVSNILGDFLYEVKDDRSGSGGRVEGALSSAAGPPRPKTASSWHSEYY